MACRLCLKHLHVHYVTEQPARICIWNSQLLTCLLTRVWPFFFFSSTLMETWPNKERRVVRVIGKHCQWKSAEQQGESAPWPYSNYTAATAEEQRVNAPLLPVVCCTTSRSHSSADTLRANTSPLCPQGRIWSLDTTLAKTPSPKPSTLISLVLLSRGA